MTGVFEKVIGGKINYFGLTPGAGIGINLPANLYQFFIAIIGILPFVVIILVIIMILRGAITWIRSGGNEKALEGAQVTIKRAMVGFISMVIIIIFSNAFSFILTGFPLNDLYTVMGPCGKYGFGLNYYNEQVGIYNDKNKDYINSSKIPDPDNPYKKVDLPSVVKYCDSLK